MNQKLRTARSGMVILFALLCIVCLSLSLILSAHFAAYAAGENSELNFTDGDGRDLWLVHYNDGETDKTVNLLNGESLGSYLVDGNNGVEIVIGSGTEKIFTPFRGEEVILSLKLNPEYKTADGALGELYDLENAVYNSASSSGSSVSSVNLTAGVVAQSNTDGAELTLEKQWCIATCCNTVDLSGVSDEYITDRVYAQTANYSLLTSALSDTVVYDITANGSSIWTVGVKHEPNGTKTYLQAGGNADDGFRVTEDAPFDESLVNAAANEHTNLINYIIRRLAALEPDAGANTTAYTLTVAAMPVVKDGVYYAQSNVSYSFSVAPQKLGNDGESDVVFGDYFAYSNLASVSYDKDSKWLDNIGFTLSLNGMALEQGKDYTVTSDSDSVGLVDLMIVGTGNLTGYHTIKNAIRVTPAKNDWEILPNIISWTYGTYKAENNLINARPVFLDNPEDIKFRIVALIADGDEIVEREIEALSNIHYFVYNDPATGLPTTNWNVTDDVVAQLKKLNAGNYRLYASVYGSSITDSEKDRNYQPLEEKSVDFKIFVGANSWEAGAEPTILGWTAGKLSTTDGLINAKPVLLDEGEETILMIYKLGENGNKDTLIYSNVHGIDASSGVDLSDINLLKGLKAGRYYLSAEVKETANYTGLKTTVLFDVVPNNLPVWAVILIVVGALGIVAVVFTVLHQKGILQMLTGKVILSMRTRANVDATLAAIRAAKVARDAEASIAAAKAREAEEAAKAENPDNK